MTDADPVARALSGLAAPPPADLADRVFASWVEAPGPLGPVYVAFTDQGISSVCPADVLGGDPERFAEEFRTRFGRPVRPAAKPPAGLIPALRSGRATGLRFDLRGVGQFDRAVLAKTLEIPPGETRPYSWVAREIGRPRAVRAAGSALGRNPVPLLIPCHRVVRNDLAPGNYGFGPALKQELLRAERVNLDECRALARKGVHFVASDTTGVFCYPSCTHARRITEEHRIGFPTADRAVDAGYRPCRHCRPAPDAA